MKDYKGVEVEKVVQEVKDEDVENELKAVQKRNARMSLVERPAKEGDTVLFDYAGFVGNEQFEGGTAERQELVLGSGMFIPGFEEQLIGTTPGEKVDVKVTFPEEYHAEELAGKEAVFHCLVHEIKEEQLPELDDEFAKDVSEFDTLQSQINPHFLYNTLDIIVWMIENEKQSEAVKAVTALARFFRISLSKGKSIIPVRDELEHVRNYLMIQHMRYKNKFSYSIEAEEEVLGLASLKLILQPMVENAIYHGMEFMDGDGEIKIRAWKEEENLYLSVEDNGLGMTEEQVERLFTDTGHVPSRRGSGIGVKNVNERIHLYFGKNYGLSIESEPDEGTTVRIHLPAIAYEEAVGKEEKHA